jgi:hypothetical protein
MYIVPNSPWTKTPPPPDLEDGRVPPGVKWVQVNWALSGETDKVTKTNRLMKTVPGFMLASLTLKSKTTYSSFENRSAKKPGAD